MRILKLEILGFKSFADRVVIQFDTGVTGIVGPNGCGKSNVVDALRWVMGEQNAKHLRGDNMQDIIFNGSQSRGPLGMAEVVLTLENDGNGVPTEYAHFAEIEVARRLYKTGDSEYEINRRPCRLRDITELFLGTGVGTKAYSIIEQGRVANIVQAKPEERRQIIEEAAGITKYKARRNAAERKMESTQQNLMRISDVLREVESQLSSLEKQAKKAERYHELQNDIRQIDLHHSSLRFLELRTQLLHLSRHEASHQNTISDLMMNMQQDESLIELERANLVNDEKQLSLSQALLYEAESAIALSKQDISFANQNFDQRQKQTVHIHEDMRRLEGRSELLLVERENAGQEAIMLEAELAASDTDLQRASASLATLSQTRVEQARSVQSSQSKLMQSSAAANKAQTDIQLLTRQRENAQLRQQTLIQEKQILATQHAEIIIHCDTLNSGLQQTKNNRSQLESSLAELTKKLTHTRETTTSLELGKKRKHEEITAKQARLQSLEEIEQSYDWGAEGLSHIMKDHADKTMGLVADQVDVSPELEELLENVLKHRLETIVVGDIDTALQLVKDQEGRIRFYIKNLSHATHENGLPNLLNDVVIFPTASEAIAFWPQARAQGLTLACMTGELFDVDGSMIGGLKSNNSGVLARKREIRELALEIEQLLKVQNKIDEEFENLRASQSEQSLQIDQLRAEIQNISLAIVRSESDLSAKESDARRIKNQEANLDAESLRITQTLAQSEQEFVSLQTAHASALQAHRQIDENMACMHAELARLDAEVAISSEHVTNLRIQVASSQERVNNLKRTQEQSTQSLDDAKQQRENLTRQLTQLAEDQAHLITQREQAEKKNIEAQKERDILSAKLAQQRNLVEDKQRALKHKETLLSTQRRELDLVKSQLNHVLLEAKECELATLALSDRLYELYRVRAEEIVFDFHLLPAPDFDIDKRLVELRRAIDHLGPINPNAVNEFNELNERHLFLKTQSDDLTKALEQLASAITKLNETTIQRFGEAFHAINEKFSHVFPRLFRGGKAWLALTQPEDMLSTGVEIFAEPPGKKLSSIALMSGGEKALTATSLIFAIFLIKPSPFCLLDEVDAPLDETNVDRFSAMVKEMSKISQFIVITHNKRTMEVTDQLYGVTMEQPGISKTVNVRVTQRDGVERVDADSAMM